MSVPFRQDAPMPAPVRLLDQFVLAAEIGDPQAYYNIWVAQVGYAGVGYVEPDYAEEETGTNATVEDQEQKIVASANNTGPVARAAEIGALKTEGYIYVCHEGGCSAKGKFRSDVSRHWKGTHGSARDPTPGARFMVRDDILSTEEGLEVAGEATSAEEFVQKWEQKHGASK